MKKSGAVRLKDCSKDLPPATWKRYLDYGVSVGLLKHENATYSFTDRFSKPLKNIAVYIKSWMDYRGDEDVNVLFATAKMGKQKKRGGKFKHAELKETLPPSPSAAPADQELKASLDSRDLATGHFEPQPAS